MKSKFITINGYSEIESVRRPKNSKKQPLSKLVKKFLKISCIVVLESIKEHKSKKRQQAHKTVYKAPKKSVAKHLAPAKTSRNFLKSKVALGVATSFVAVILCVATTLSGVTIGASALEDINEPGIKSEIQEISVNDSEISKTVYGNISKSMSDEVLTPGYGLYIDKELVGVSLDKKSLKKALQADLNAYKAKYDDETTDKYANQVEIVAGSYKSVDIDDAENIVAKNKDKFSYSLSTDISYKQRVPFATTVKYDSTKYTSYKRTIQHGISERQKIIYRVTYVDGVQTDACATKIKTLKKGQNKIIVVGTKKKVTYKPAATYSAPATTYSTGSTYASGSFMWPVPHTRNITSGYGPRWGRFHSGIDIAGGGDYGKAIVASDAGTVTWAGYDSSGYGNYVIIDHGNGYQTLYGHCSTVYVSRGQRVSKGQSIAAIGSTGNSTGPHLHFEVRRGGSRLNPLGFV